MDDLGFFDEAENALDGVTGMARNAPRIAAAVVDQAAGDLVTLGGNAGYRSATFELAADGDDTDWQQTLPFPQSIDRAAVEDQPAVQLEVVGKPLLARGRQAIACAPSAPVFAK